jgi:hypothetical protein
MINFFLFCKSYRNDVLRTKRLCESIASFNRDQIPFYLSVPSQDLDLFKQTINFDNLNESGCGTFHWVTDEEIVQSHPSANLDRYIHMKGYFSQQVIKAEAWRLIGLDNYLCLDADAFFTKDFYLRNFIHSDSAPYTLMHDAKELLDLADKFNKPFVKINYLADSRRLKEEFGRSGQDYDFGPSPLIWSAKVWQSLEQFHLKKKNETIWEAIERIPLEIRWYGEALLAFQAIPVHPIGPIFSCYHYEWQYQEACRQSNPIQAKTLGVVMQSNWEQSLQPAFAKKSWLSRTCKKIKAQK